MKCKLVLCLLLVSLGWSVRSCAQGANPPASPAQIAELKKILNAGVDARERGADPDAEKGWTDGLAKAKALGTKTLTWQFLHNLGLLACNRGSFFKALDYDREALQLSQNLDNQQFIAESLNGIGNDDLGLGRYGEALNYYQQALKIEQQGKLESYATDTLHNIGVVYFYTGQWVLAEKSYNEVLQQYRDQHDKNSTIDVLINLGLLNIQMGLQDKATEFFKKALEEMPPTFKSARAEALNGLGQIYFVQGQYDLALEAYTEALALARDVDAKDIQANCLNNMANFYSETGQFAEAEEYHLTANKLLTDIGNPVPIAVSDNNLAAVYVHQKRYQEAIAWCEKGEKILKTVFSPLNLANIYINLGGIYQELGNFDKAMEYLNRAKKLYKGAGDTRYLPTALDNLGQIEIELKQFSQAEASLKASRESREALENPQKMAQTLLFQGRLYMNEGKPDQARAAFAQAVEKYDQMTQDAGSGSQIIGFQQMNLSPYKAYAASLLEISPSDALISLERGRGRGLAKQMAQNLADLFLPKSEAARWRSANQEFRKASRLAEAAQNYARTAVAADRPTAEKRSADAVLSKANASAKMAQVAMELSQRYPVYRFWSGAAPATIKQLQALANRNPDTLYLEWAVVDDHQTILLTLSQRDGLHAFSYMMGQDALEKSCSDYRAAITAMGKLLSGNTVEDLVTISKLKDTEPSLARKLSDTLLSPLEKAGMLKEGRYKRLVIVPDGPLVNLPFAALMDKTGNRLGSRFVLSSSISLAILTWPATPRQSSSDVLCVAPFAGASQQLPISTERGGYGLLPFSGQEVLAIKKAIPDTKEYLRSQATKTTWLQQAGSRAVLHFATHGILDNRDGLHSSLLFASDTGSQKTYDTLDAREILMLPLSAQLAVLSACDSGLGQQSNGEGNLGLAWAFRVAGCSAVMASQWEINDRTTAMFMNVFYKQLKAGRRKDDALHSAMEWIRKDPKRDNPYFWAAFQIVGDTQPIHFPK
jgi:CHAT domain-containing protein/Tfp pilus assembly protein PilF